MATIMVKGQDVRVGDDFWFLSTPHRITRIERYVHPVVTRNEEWRIAYSDGPDRLGKNAWGITLEFNHGYAAGCEITLLPGDDRTDGGTRVDPGDYLDPFLSTASALWARYEDEGKPGLWRAWVEALPPEDLPGPHPSGLACFTGVQAAVNESAAPKRRAKCPYCGRTKPVTGKGKIRKHWVTGGPITTQAGKRVVCGGSGRAV